MNTALLVWGLWVVSGGPVNGGGLWTLDLQATFATRAGCEHAKAALTEIYSTESNRNRTMKCVESDYVTPETQKKLGTRQ